MAVVVGNPKSGSRTLRVAQAVADALAKRLAGSSVMSDGSDRLVVDLADIAPELFVPGSPTVGALLEAVAGSDVVVVASPTFKATYTGILKSFFDGYGANALSAVVAVPVMTGAGPIHALAPEVHLRPLLVELGASTPTRSLYVTEPQFDDLDTVIDAWADTAGPLVARSLT
ncbi:MAG: NAD(P)H-dependent oxidoreductase [Acidimicrobiales bacterium]